NWQVEAIGYAGTAKPPARARVHVIAGDRMTCASPKVEYVLRLAPTRQPREIDLAPLTGKNKGKAVYKGIYKLENDTLTIRYAPAGGARPTNFQDPDQDAQHRVMVMKRLKPKGEGGP